MAEERACGNNEHVHRFARENPRFDAITIAKRFALRKGRWELSDDGPSANALMIGIELENVGEVRAVGASFSGWPFGQNGATGPIVAEADTVVRGKRRYHGFPKPQQMAARRLLRAIAAEYGLGRRAVAWGHRDIDPKRKTDPGPVWAEDLLPAILDEVFGKG